MKLSFPAFVVAAISLTFASISNAQTVRAVVGTNAPVPTGTNAVAQTEPEPKVAKPPAALYTNCVDMVLVKVGDFWAGKYEVTQSEYQKITGSNPSAFSGAQRPVDNVSWNDAMAFCDKLTAEDIEKLQLPAGYRYTLPTEGQWESLVGDASLADSVTSQGGPRDGTMPVGSLGPNNLGLYDVRGNVSEFTLGDESKPYRVLRGGSWQERIEINLRVEFRIYRPPDDHQNTFGFRCVLLPPAGGGH